MFWGEPGLPVEKYEGASAPLVPTPFVVIGHGNQQGALAVQYRDAHL